MIWFLYFHAFSSVHRNISRKDTLNVDEKYACTVHRYSALGTFSFCRMTSGLSYAMLLESRSSMARGLKLARAAYGETKDPLRS